MFKIKDGISLNVLEDFGFRYVLLLGDGNLPHYIRVHDNITVSTYFREIIFYDVHNKWTKIKNGKKYIKDLIKAGIVEKVSE